MRLAEAIPEDMIAVRFGGPARFVAIASKAIETWRKAAKRGLADLEAHADGELDFQRAYYAHLDAALALLAKRFGT